MGPFVRKRLNPLTPSGPSKDLVVPCSLVGEQEDVKVSRREESSDERVRLVLPCSGERFVCSIQSGPMEEENSSGSFCGVGSKDTAGLGRPLHVRCCLVGLERWVSFGAESWFRRRKDLSFYLFIVSEGRREVE